MISKHQFEAVFNAQTPEDMRQWAINNLKGWLTLLEESTGYCEFTSGGTCTSPSVISAHINKSYTTATYSWVVIGADIDGSSTEDFITVTTPQGDTDVPYTVQLTTIIDGIEYYIEQQYTQVKTLEPIRITDIIETVPGSCELI